MGGLVLFLALGAAAFGLWQHLKGKRIWAAPFKTTGDLAKNPVSPDPKGLMSTEGQVVAPQQAALTPCSKTSALYYEVDIRRLWKKYETTQDGTKERTGSSSITVLKGGARFGLNDGTGVIYVDASKGGDFDNMKKGYNEKVGVPLGTVATFGELNFTIPPAGKDEITTGFEVIEKYVPVEGKLFALGKLEGDTLMKPGFRSMMFSSKGRDGLLAATNKKRKMSFIGAGVGAALAIPLMLFGPKIDTRSAGGSSYCAHELADGQAKCSASMLSKSGDDYNWVVTQDGTYKVIVRVPTNKKFHLEPKITVTNAGGEVVADEAYLNSADALTATVALKPGAYTLNVKDATDFVVKGGFDYALEIEAPAVAAPAAMPVAEGTKVADPLNAEPAAKPVKNVASAKKKAGAKPRNAPKSR